MNKHLKISILVGSLLLVTGTLTACGNNKQAEKQTEVTAVEKDTSQLSDEEFEELVRNGADYLNTKYDFEAIKEDYSNLETIKVYYDNSRSRFIIMYDTSAPYFALQKEKGNLKDFIRLPSEEEGKIYREGTPVKTYDLEEE